MLKRCLITATKLVVSFAGFLLFCMVGRPGWGG